MTDPVFSVAPPRAESDALFRRSCFYWNTAFWLITLNACMALGLPITLSISGDLGVVETILWVALTPLLGTGAVKLYRARSRLRRVWRLGERIDVVVRDWGRNYGYWYVTIVEHDGRRGVVDFRKMPDEGATLPALVYGSEIAVLEPAGVLRPGRLAPRQS